MPILPHRQPSPEGEAIHALGNQPAGLAKLLLVAASCAIDERDAVRRENQNRIRASLRGHLFERGARQLDHRFDKAGMIEEHAELVDDRCGWADLCLGRRNVLTILPAA